MSRHHRLNLLVAAAVLAPLACDQKPVDLAPQPPYGQWREILPLPSHTPSVFSVWSFGSSDVWIATSRGVERYDGSDWSLATDQVPYAQDVWGSSPSDVYVATGDGAWHYNGAGWTELSIEAELLAGTGPSDVYAARNNQLFHFSGADWDTILTSDFYIRFVSALPGPDCLVSNYDSLWSWNGTNWSTLPAPASIRDMWRYEKDSWFAVGYKPSEDRIWHCDSGVWSEVFRTFGSLGSIWGSSDHDVYVIADGGLLHYAGSSWDPIPRFTSSSLVEVGGFNASDVFAVGYNGHVHQLQESEWPSIHPIGPPSFGLEVFWVASPNNFFFGSSGRSVLQYTNTEWSEHVFPFQSQFPTRVYDIVGTSSDDVFATFGDVIAQFDGENWIISADSLLTAGWVTDMWALSSGHVYTAGAGGYVFDGLNWTSTYDGGLRTTAVWAYSPTCVYAVGEQGVLRYNGVEWSRVKAGLECTDVWGSSCDDVYVAHAGGISHFNGTHWTSIEPYPVFMQFVIGQESNIIAIGDEQTFQYDRGLWLIGEHTLRFSDIGLSQQGFIVGLARTVDGNGVVEWQNAP